MQRDSIRMMLGRGCLGTLCEYNGTIAQGTDDEMPEGHTAYQGTKALDWTWTVQQVFKPFSLRHDLMCSSVLRYRGVLNLQEVVDLPFSLEEAGWTCQPTACNPQLPRDEASIRRQLDRGNPGNPSQNPRIVSSFIHMVDCCTALVEF